MNDLLNSELLDEDFSYAGGCGLPPTCLPTKVITTTERKCTKIAGKEVCVTVPKVKTVANQSCVDSRNKYADCVKQTAKDIGTNIKDTASGIGKDIKTTASGIKKDAKKVVRKLKDKVGAVGKKFRNRFRKILRKGILLNIKNNIHGLASRLYPAVASDSDIKKRKYKASFVVKSKKIYNQLVAKWTKLGGSESELRSAIKDGSAKRFLKMPYMSAQGNNSFEFYDYFSPKVGTYYGDNGEVDSDEEGVYDESTGEEEVIDQEEQTRGLRGFFAWLLGLFKRNDANENPYEDGSELYSEYGADYSSDRGNEPADSEANNDIMNELDKSQDDDDSDGDTILGIPKTAFWIGVSVLALGGVFVAYKMFKK